MQVSKIVEEEQLYFYVCDLGDQETCDKHIVFLYYTSIIMNIILFILSSNRYIITDDGNYYIIWVPGEKSVDFNLKSFAFTFYVRSVSRKQVYHFE